MYKSIEITEVIGSFYAQGIIRNEFEIEEISKICKQVNSIDRFVSINDSGRALLRAEQIASSKILRNKKSIIIPDNQKIRKHLRRWFGPE